MAFGLIEHDGDNQVPKTVTVQERVLGPDERIVNKQAGALNYVAWDHFSQTYCAERNPLYRDSGEAK